MKPDIGQLIEILYHYGFNIAINPATEAAVNHIDHVAPSVRIDGTFQSIDSDATIEDVFTLLRLTIIELAEELQRYVYE